MRQLPKSLRARHTGNERRTWRYRGVQPVRPTRNGIAAAVWFRVAAVLAGAALVAAAAPALAAGRPSAPVSPAVAASRAAATAGHRPAAVIRRTAGGVPHILADDWTSLGFGYGFAFAQDNLCTMANDYVTVEAQRSRYFGPAASYIQRGNGVIVSNLDSDLFFRQIIDSRSVERLTRDLSPAERQVEAGYVRGYNHYLASVGGAKGVPDPTCRGQAWVKPITIRDSYLRFYQLMLLAGEDTVISGISQAAPPSAPAAATRRGGCPGRSAPGRAPARGPMARSVRDGRQQRGGDRIGRHP